MLHARADAGARGGLASLRADIARAPPPFVGLLRASLADVDASPSRAQDDVAAALEGLGLSVAHEHVLPEGLSVDVALEPLTCRAVAPLLVQACSRSCGRGRFAPPSWVLARSCSWPSSSSRRALALLTECSATPIIAHFLAVEVSLHTLGPKAAGARFAKAGLRLPEHIEAERPELQKMLEAPWPLRMARERGHPRRGVLRRRPCLPRLDAPGHAAAARVKCLYHTHRQLEN